MSADSSHGGPTGRGPARCAICHRNPDHINTDHSECSHPDCLHRHPSPELDHHDSNGWGSYHTQPTCKD